MSRQVQITPEMQNALGLLASMFGGKMPRKQRSDKGFTKQAVAAAQTTEERRKALEEATIRAFTKAGYKDVQPRVNVLVYGRPAKDDKPATGWIAQGREVKKGEKAVYVKAPGMHGKGIPMFHITQTSEVAATEQPQSENSSEASASQS